MLSESAAGRFIWNLFLIVIGFVFLRVDAVIFFDGDFFPPSSDDEEDDEDEVELEFVEEDEEEVEEEDEFEFAEDDEESDMQQTSTSSSSSSLTDFTGEERTVLKKGSGTSSIFSESPNFSSNFSFAIEVVSGERSRRGEKSPP